MLTLHTKNFLAPLQTLQARARQSQNPKTAECGRTSQFSSTACYTYISGAWESQTLVIVTSILALHNNHICILQPLHFALWRWAVSPMVSHFQLSDTCSFSMMAATGFSAANAFTKGEQHLGFSSPATSTCSQLLKGGHDYNQL